MAGSILDDTIIAARYFFPRRAPLADPFVVTCRGGDLHCYRSSPHAGARTLVHFHGNGEVVADYVPDHAAAINAIGLNVVFAEYRGYGGSSGEPALAAMLADTDDVFHAVGVPESELVVYGRSVGSIYAIEMASRYPGIAGLVIESGIADVLERLLLRMQPQELGVTREELEAAVAATLDHRDKLGRLRAPLLVIHALDDELVDASHAKRNHAWAGSARKDLVLFESGGHNALLVRHWDRYLRTLERFFAQL